MESPKFDIGEATEGEKQDFAAVSRLTAQQLAQLSLGSWFQPGQFVGSERLRLTDAGLAAHILAKRVKEGELSLQAAETLQVQAREIREQARHTLSAN